MALDTVEQPVTHVTQLCPEYTTSTPGQNRAPDELIAERCADGQIVLVTVDSDFRGRWLRTGVLANHGVEVIVFTKDLEGLDQQHQVVTRWLPNWKSELGKKPYGYRVWDQPVNRSLYRRKSKYRI